MRLAARIVAALVLAALAGRADAHTRGSSYWRVDADATPIAVHARVPVLELTRLGVDPQRDLADVPRAAAAIRDGLQLRAASGACTAGAPQARNAGDGWLSVDWTVDCPAGTPLTLRARLFEAVAPSHLYFVRVDAGGRVQERVLGFDTPGWTLGEAVGDAGLRHFVALGIGHILSGWDHLAFVLALILLSRRLRDIAVIATGFTLAHSATLAAAVLGWVRVQPAGVEALIGFSIALVAAESLWRHAGEDRLQPATLVLALVALAVPAALWPGVVPATALLALALFSACYFGLAAGGGTLRWRAAIAALFGLVHGFGFAGALAELELPRAALAGALLGFNVGVELGQLGVIAVAWPLLELLRRRPRLERLALPGLSAALVAVGSFWFVLRSFG